MVVLEGRLDRDSVPTVHRNLRRSLHLKNVRELTLDLARVDYLDTAGIALLVEWHCRLAKHNGKLVLAGLHDDLLKRISLARLDRLFGLDVLSDSH